ncbi:MAG: enoyl-CoA hydratase-related protein [Halieaceae bacterium]|jgi:2-(1,2-epoxy-1,2-dihydrophenyl)acetyl-CoA isomerase|nr:enoyl-CoA hydratase-related protein [Halieaceae bacterium]
MTAYSSMQLAKDGPVAILRFSRPDTLNAIEASIRREFLVAANELNADESIRVVILTGAGRAFCAGADLTETPQEGFDVETMLNQEYKPALLAVTEAPKPWISAVNGAAAGIGSAFAMNCDMTVMAEDAYLYQAFAAISLVPDGGAHWHLVRTLGKKRAYELIALGEKLPAQRCLELGLCNRVVPSERLMDEAMALALELAGKAPLSLRYAKQALHAATTESLADNISTEARLQKLCMNSEDAREGALAFLEKRAPVFKGK